MIGRLTCFLPGMIPPPSLKMEDALATLDHHGDRVTPPTVTFSSEIQHQMASTPFLFKKLVTHSHFLPPLNSPPSLSIRKGKTAQCHCAFLCVPPKRELSLHVDLPTPSESIPGNFSSNLIYCLKFLQYISLKEKISKNSLNQELARLHAIFFPLGGPVRITVIAFSGHLQDGVDTWRPENTPGGLATLAAGLPL